MSAKKIYNIQFSVDFDVVATSNEEALKKADILLKEVVLDPIARKARTEIRWTMDYPKQKEDNNG